MDIPINNHFLFRHNLLLNFIYMIKHMLCKAILGLLFVMIPIIGYSQDIPLPSEAQLRWQKYEQIMFLCLDPCTWQGREYDNHSYPISKINPKQLDTDQWCKVAKSWDAKMILFVAKHAGGFCWWQTNTTEYGIKNTSWRNGNGDVLRDLSESCKKYGLDLGIYVYPGDEQWGAGIGSGGKTEDPTKQEAYNKIYRQQLTEVLTKYGPIKEVWFDGNCHVPINDILEKYASDAVILQSKKANIRWVGNEDGIAPNPNWYMVNKKDLDTGISTALHSDVNGDCYAPVEVDVPMLKNNAHKRFWAPNTDHLLLSVEQLMNLYYKSVGRGAVLLLNSTPDTTGLIPVSHVKRYAEFGKEIKKRFAHPIKKTSGNTQELILDLGKPTVVNHCILQEQLEKGQRVTSYTIEGLDKDDKWILLSKGTSIGNKKIDYFPNVSVSQVRLRIQSSKSIPQISNFAVYQVESDLSDILAMNNLEKPIVISSWEKDTYSEEEWTDVVFDLTPYVNSIGHYDIVFNLLAGDYITRQPTGLQFKDWKLEMYGKEFPEGITKLEGKNVFRITRSQQTLDEFPTRLRMKIKRNPAKSTGEVTIQRIVY